MFKKSVISLMIVFLWFDQLTCQIVENLNYRALDSITYTEYSNQQWKDVIHFGDIALDKNIDYYYLRMRMGISSYNLGRYPEAANHFEKALIFNSKAPTAQLYLYDSYKLIGKNTKAYKLRKGFTDNTLAQVTPKKKIVEAIYAGGGYSFSNNYSLNNNFFLDENQDSLSGYRTLIGDKSDVYAGLSFNFSPSVSLYVGYNHLQIKKKINLQYIEVPLIVDSIHNEDWGFQKFFSADTVFLHRTFDEIIQQSEIYLNAKIQFDKGWALTLFSNMILVNSGNIKANTTSRSVTDTSYYVYGFPPEVFTYNYDEVQFTRTDSSFTNFVVGLNLEKDFNNITINLAASISKLNGIRQRQLRVSTFYYLTPYANFYGSTGITGFVQLQKDGGKEKRLIFDQKIGSKLYRNFWGEVEITYGNLNNANTDNGFIVYNQADKMKFKTGLTLSIFLGAQIELNLLYRYISYEGIFAEESNDEQNSLITHSFNYQTQNIFGGIKWKF